MSLIWSLATEKIISLALSKVFMMIDLSITASP